MQLGPLTIREEGRWMVFENWVLRKIYGPKKKVETGNCVIRSIMILLLVNCLVDEIKKDEVGRPCNMHWGEERCVLGSGG
jgi:hypothetical protein